MVRSRILPPALLCALAACALLPAGTAGRTQGDPQRPKPNVVVIMTDDQTYDDMVAMPRTKALIGDQGTTFTHAYVSYPLCCPSRATYLTGQYAHNTGVRSTVPPTGGVEALREKHTLPVWLHAAGYDTAHIGKYLNGYGLRHAPTVPPGWTDWHGAVDKSTYQMYGYRLFENGETNTYGSFRDEDPALYQTDVLGQKAVDVIDEHADGETPFFLSVAFVAPHGEVTSPGGTTRPYIRPAPRDIGRFAGRSPAGSPAYDEQDVSDKPPYVREHAPLHPGADARIAHDYQARLESLIAVDEAVERIVRALEASDQIDDTYILFTSDNGFFQGEHRIARGKYLAYDPSTHVPLLIRGPDIPVGAVSDELIPNTDLAPTIVDVTGASADITMDGRSIRPFAERPGLRTGRPILHEGLIDGDNDRDGWGRRGKGVGVYYAIRTARYLFVMWRGGQRELYDLAADPYELESRDGDPAYARVKGVLTDVLQTLRHCRGTECLQGVTALKRASHRSARR